MIGRTVAHYEIQGKLGAGAMGEVYLATDTSLGRKVALKFLPDSMSEDVEARTRLLHEAQNASLLNHPNVVTIHAIEHVDGDDFIVMEFIEGQTLKDVLAEGQLSIGRIVEIGTALCDGLSAAHEKGIIHRDIKPDNIFITTRGHVKIADFGIARSQQGAGATRTGMPVGTVAYMSPEQARGEKGLDARSDVFSLGCVIYEMAVGRRPFEGEHLTAVLYELLSENPLAPSSLRPDLPAGFDELITGVLAKDRESRYQTALELASALRSVGRDDVRTVTPTPRPKEKPDSEKSDALSKQMRIGIGLSVVAMLVVVVVGYTTFSKYFPFIDAPDVPDRKMLAVLPFNNIGSPDQEYFADGLTDEVITRLGRVGGLGVVSRTSVWKYKKTEMKASEIADDLGVEYLMEGTVKWASKDRVRVTSRLVSARQDIQLWEVTYDTLLSDILTIQTDIAERVTGAMHITLMESERQNLARGGTKNVDALLASYRGLAHFHGSIIVEDVKSAVSSYRAAVTYDPQYVQAWAHLAISHAKMVWYGFEKDIDHAASAKVAAETAVRLDPESPEAQLASGYYFYWVAKDYTRALEKFTEIERSGVKNSELYNVYSAIAYVQRRRGEFEKTIAYLQIALTQDPDRNVRDLAAKFAERAWEIGTTYLRLRRWAEAERYLLEARNLAPFRAEPYVRLARVQVYGFANPDSAFAILMSAPPSVDIEALSEERVTVCILRRDTKEARRQLIIANADTVFYQLQKAKIAELENNDQARRIAYDSALVDVARQVAADPDYPALHRWLGIVLAGLGRHDEAVRAGRKALEMQPVESEPFYSGPSNLEAMAMIHTLLGDTDEAVTLLDSLLRVPAGLITPGYLKIAPEYDPLRGNPRFEALLSQGQPTSSVAEAQRVWAVRQ